MKEFFVFFEKIDFFLIDLDNRSKFFNKKEKNGGCVDKGNV